MGLNRLTSNWPKRIGRTGRCRRPAWHRWTDNFVGPLFPVEIFVTCRSTQIVFELEKKNSAGISSADAQSPDGTATVAHYPLVTRKFFKIAAGFRRCTQLGSCNSIKWNFNSFKQKINLTLFQVESPSDDVEIIICGDVTLDICLHLASRTFRPPMEISLKRMNENSFKNFI